MTAHVYDQFAVNIDRGKLLEHLHITAGSDDADVLDEMCREVEQIGCPKVMARTAYIEEKGTDFVVVDGIRLSSRVLRVNVDRAYKLVPYVATCGLELEQWSKGYPDILEQYWADAVKQWIMRQAVNAFRSMLDDEFGLTQTATMNPGSLEDWPISEQQHLFKLLGDPESAIGVTLTDSFLMIPSKSVSGICFPTEVNYSNCQLCPREECPGRIAPYDHDLYETKYTLP